MVGVLESSSPRPAARLWAHPASMFNLQQTFWALLAGTSLLALGTPWLKEDGILQAETHAGTSWPFAAVVGYICVAFSAGWVVVWLMAAVLDAFLISPLSTESARSSGTTRPSPPSAFTRVASVLPWTALLTGCGLAVWPQLQQGLLLGPGSLPYIHAALLSILQVAGAGGRHSWAWPLAMGICHGVMVLRDMAMPHGALGPALHQDPPQTAADPCSGSTSTVESCAASTGEVVDGLNASSWLQQAVTEGVGSNSSGSNTGHVLGAWLHVTEEAMVYALLSLVVLLCSPLLASTLNSVVMDTSKARSGRKKAVGNKAASRLSAVAQADDWPPVNSMSEPSFSEIPGQKEKLTPLERLLDSGASSVMSGSDDPFRFLSSDLLQGQRGSFTGTPPATPSPLATFPGDAQLSPAALETQPPAKPASPATVQRSLLLLRLADAAAWLAISVALSARYMLGPVAPAWLSHRPAFSEPMQPLAASGVLSNLGQEGLPLLPSPWGILGNGSTLEPLCLVGCMFITCGCVGLVLLEAYVTMLMDQGTAKHHPKPAISTAGFALALVAKSGLLLLVPPAGLSIRLPLLLGLLLSTLALGATARMHVPSTMAALGASVPTLLLAGSTPHCTLPCACCTWAAAALLPLVMLHSSRSWSAITKRVAVLPATQHSRHSGSQPNSSDVHHSQEEELSNSAAQGRAEQDSWVLPPEGMSDLQDVSPTSVVSKPNWHQLYVQPQQADGMEVVGAARRQQQEQSGSRPNGMEQQDTEVHEEGQHLADGDLQQGRSGQLPHSKAQLLSIPEEEQGAARSRRGSASMNMPAASALPVAGVAQGVDAPGQLQLQHDVNEAEGSSGDAAHSADEQYLLTRHSAPPRLAPPPQLRHSLDTAAAARSSGPRRSFMETLQARLSKASSEPHEGQQRLSMESGGLDLTPQDAQALLDLQDAASTYDQLLSRAGRATSGLAPPQGWPDAHAAAYALGSHQHLQPFQAAALAAAAAGVNQRGGSGPLHHIAAGPPQMQDGSPPRFPQDYVYVDAAGTAYALQAQRLQHPVWSGPLPHSQQHMQYNNANMQQYWDGSYMPADSEPLMKVGYTGSPPLSYVQGMPAPTAEEPLMVTAPASGQHAPHAGGRVPGQSVPAHVPQQASVPRAPAAAARPGYSTSGSSKQPALGAQEKSPAWPQAAGTAAAPSNRPSSTSAVPVIPTNASPQPLDPRPLQYRPYQNGNSSAAVNRKVVSMPNGPGAGTRPPRPQDEPRHWAEKLNMACERLMHVEPRPFFSVGPGARVSDGPAEQEQRWMVGSQQAMPNPVAAPNMGGAGHPDVQSGMLATGKLSTAPQPARPASGAQVAASPFQQQQSNPQAAPRYIKRGPYSGGLHKLPDTQQQQQQHHRTAAGAGPSVQLAAAVSAPQQVRRQQPARNAALQRGAAPGNNTADRAAHSSNVTAPGGGQPPSRNYAVTTRSSNASRQSTLASIPEFGMLGEEGHSGLVWVTAAHGSTGVLPPRRTASWGSMAAAADSGSRSSNNSANTGSGVAVQLANAASQGVPSATAQVAPAAAPPGAARVSRPASGTLTSAGSMGSVGSAHSGMQGMQQGLDINHTSAPLRAMDVAAFTAAAAGVPSMSDPGSGPTAWVPRQLPHPSSSATAGGTQPGSIARQSSGTNTSGQHSKSNTRQGDSSSHGASQRPQLFSATEVLRRMQASMEHS